MDEVKNNEVERRKALSAAIEVLKTQPGVWQNADGSWILEQVVTLSEGIRKYIQEGSV